jgi:uncharacterized protein YceK
VKAILRRFAIILLLTLPVAASGCSTFQSSTNPSAGSRTAVKRASARKVSADTIPNAADIGL